jgi:small subunit ribosomal protein S20
MIKLRGINVKSIQRRYEMPNIKSAKKRVLVTAKKTARNKSIKSEVKTEIKKFLALVDGGDKKAAAAQFPHTCSVIDSAVSKGILKKNTAANKKSGLAKKLNAMA